MCEPCRQYARACVSLSTRSVTLFGSQIHDAVDTLMGRVMSLRAECERVLSSLLPDAKSILHDVFVLDNLLHKVFKYRRKEAALQHPGTLSQQEIDDAQPFRDWMQSMQLLRFSIEFEKRKCADLDVLVSIGINQVYHMIRQITSMTDKELALFMLNFSNIVYAQHSDEDDQTVHQTMEQLPFWYKDIQARARQASDHATGN